MLALAAKDASVIITIKKLQKGTDAKPDRVQYKVFKKQCNEYAGIIANLQTDISYAYTIGLIDIDRKPVDKVSSLYPITIYIIIIIIIIRYGQNITKSIMFV